MTIADNKLQEILFTEEQLRARIAELGRQITHDYKNAQEPLVVVGMLKGSVLFLADLFRCIDLPCRLDFMAASSYHGTETTGTVNISKDVRDIEGKHVLLVEDIVDSGFTMNYILKMLKDRKAASVKLCSLLDKPGRRHPGLDIPIDYLGFTIEDKFVVGYGLDFDQLYRNLPYIGVLKPECYQ